MVFLVYMFKNYRSGQYVKVIQETGFLLETEQVQSSFMHFFKLGTQLSMNLILVYRDKLAFQLN